MGWGSLEAYRVVVKEKESHFAELFICVESKTIQVVWEFLKLEVVVFHNV